MKAQVAIIGAGRAGMLLSQILRQEGVDCVVIDRPGDGHSHDGMKIAWAGRES